MIPPRYLEISRILVKIPVSFTQTAKSHPPGRTPVSFRTLTNTIQMGKYDDDHDRQQKLKSTFSYLETLPAESGAVCPHRGNWLCMYLVRDKEKWRVKNEHWLVITFSESSILRKSDESPVALCLYKRIISFHYWQAMSEVESRFPLLADEVYYTTCFFFMFFLLVGFSRHPSFSSWLYHMRRSLRFSEI